MRVAVLTSSYPRFRGDSSGHFVEAEAVLCARSGAEIHVLAPGQSLHQRDDVALKLWPLGVDRLFGPPGALERVRTFPVRSLELLPFFARSLRVLKRLRPVDRLVAHFLLPSAYPVVCLAGGWALEVEAVAHGSDVALLLRLPSPLRNAIVEALLRAVTRFRFVSEALLESLVARLPAPQAKALRRRSVVRLPAIELPDGVRARTPERCRKVWVSAGRLIASKRVDLALRRAAVEDATLVVLGDGPERGRLEALARSLRVDARFLGQVSRHDALTWIASADRLVHLSEAEGAPSVVREARALGVPVLVRPIGDLRAWAASDPGIELDPSQTADANRRVLR